MGRAARVILTSSVAPNVQTVEKTTMKAMVLPRIVSLSETDPTYRLEDANKALMELRRGGVRGAKVLVVD